MAMFKHFRTQWTIVLAFATLAVGGCAAGHDSEALTPRFVAAGDALAMPKAQFQWKALWTWMAPNANADHVAKTVALAKRAGFNVLIVNTTGGGKASYASKLVPMPAGRAVDPLAETIRQAHDQGLKVYAWISYLRTFGGRKYLANHPGHIQVVTVEEDAKARAGTRSNPDRVDVHAGSWLCPDRGLSDIERGVTEEIVRNYDVDGIAIDFLGYRNHVACYCEYSKAARRKFAAEHSSLSRDEVLRRFSEESLIEFSRQVSDTVKGIKPNVKIACHVYPDFDPNPLYANRLHVDDCGQTIAWFYVPHWSYDTISKKHKAFMNADRRGLERNRHVAFIGYRGGALKKSAARLRNEIRIAGSEGCDRLMFAFNFTLEKSPELVRVLSEELN
jgi:Glycosyl hydrolase-like 10